LLALLFPVEIVLEEVDVEAAVVVASLELGGGGDGCC